MPEANADFTPDVFDNTYLNMELEIPRDGDRPDIDKLTKRLRDKDGMPIGRAHNNPILNTRISKVEYKDRHKDSLAANKITENMFAQFYGRVNLHFLFQEVEDYRFNGTGIKEQDASIITRNGIKHCRETKNGVEVFAQWKDEKTTWATLKDMEYSYPVQMAEQRRIVGNPEFACWIRNVLTKRKFIIGKLKLKYWVCTHKFGVKIPKSAQEANSFYE